MKKLLNIFLSTVMCVSLVACSTDTKPTSVPEEPSSQNEQVEVDKNLATVEITFPASMFTNEETPEQYVERMQQEERFKDIHINNDGSVTLKVSKSTHKAMLNDVIQSIDTLFPNEEVLSIKKVTHNDNLTDFNIYCDQKALENGLDGFAVFSLYMATQMYHIYEGAPDTVTTFHYIDEASEVEFDTFMMPDDFNK